MLLEDGRGTPIPYEMILIGAEEANQYINTTTDKNGLARFSINTDNVMATSLTVRVSVERDHLKRWNLQIVFSPTEIKQPHNLETI